jgi:hypothetical protein
MSACAPNRPVLQPPDGGWYDRRHRGHRRRRLSIEARQAFAKVAGMVPLGAVEEFVGKCGRTGTQSSPFPTTSAASG